MKRMKLTEILVKFLKYLCIFVTISFTLTVLTQVLARAMKFSLPGTEEISRLLVVWLAFLGTSLAIHEKMHLSVSFFVKKASEKYQKIIYFLVNILVLGFFSILAIYGLKLTMETITNPTPILQLPMGIFYASIPISSLFSIYFTAISMFEPPGEGESTV